MGETETILLTVLAMIGGVLLTLVVEPILGRPIERAVVGTLGFLGGGVGVNSLDLTGIWRSTYTYTTRDGSGEYRGHHFVVLRQFRNRVTVHSLPHPEDSEVWMELELDSGLVLTGRWREKTGKDLEFYGAIQFLVRPSRTELEGRWVGFGRSRSVKTNTWEMSRESTRKGRRVRKRYTQKAAREFAIPRSKQTGARVLGYPDQI